MFEVFFFLVQNKMLHLASAAAIPNSVLKMFNVYMTSKPTHAESTAHETIGREADKSNRGLQRMYYICLCAGVSHIYS